jgi:NTE family protein
MQTAKIGLALGSGAARGWAHIGVIEALLEAGIVPDIVCGTSMGALVGGAYASGNLKRLTEWAMAADRRVVASMVDIGVMAGGLVDGTRIVELLASLGMTADIADLRPVFAAVATDLTTGREIWLQAGPLNVAIRASASLPGIFRPSFIDGRWLVDGGLVNPVPVSLCRALGADFVIAVNLNEDLLGRRLVVEDTSDDPVPPKEELGTWRDLLTSVPVALRQQALALAPRLFGQGSAAPGYFDVLANSLNIMQDHITRSRLAGDPPHVQIMPRVMNVSPMDFHRAAEAISEGRAATERILPAITGKIGQL